MVEKVSATMPSGTGSASWPCSRSETETTLFAAGSCWRIGRRLSSHWAGVRRPAPAPQDRGQADDARHGLAGAEEVMVTHTATLAGWLVVLSAVRANSGWSPAWKTRPPAEASVISTPWATNRDLAIWADGASASLPASRGPAQNVATVNVAVPRATVVIVNISFVFIVCFIFRECSCLSISRPRAGQLNCCAQ